MDGIANFIINNPVNQKIVSGFKKVLFKNNGEIVTTSKEIVKVVANPSPVSLFEVNNCTNCLQQVNFKDFFTF